jgi:hypothetical protein
MREIRSSGSAEGVMSNHDPYSDFELALSAGPRLELKTLLRQIANRVNEAEMSWR